MALRDSYNSIIDTALTLSTASDKITSAEVKGAFLSSMDYTDAVVETLDAGTKQATSSLFTHNLHSNITFTYDPLEKKLKATVAALPEFDTTPTLNSSKILTSGAVALSLADKEGKLPVSGKATDVLVGTKGWKNLTTAIVPEDTDPLLNRKYFTEGRVLDTVIPSSYAQPSVSSNIAAGDKLIAALGKLEKQIDSIQITGGSSTIIRQTVSGLKSISSPSSSLLYYTTDAGREGIWTYDSAMTALTADPDDNGLTIYNTITKKLYRRIFDGKNVYLDWYGTQTNYRKILQDLWNAEYTVHGTAGKIYPIVLADPNVSSDENISIKDKNVFFEGNGCTLQINALTLSHSNRLLVHEVTFGTAYPIIGFGDAANIGAEFQGADELFVTGIMDVKQGDVLRIHSKELCHPMFVGGTGSDGEWAPIVKAENIVVQRVVHNTSVTPNTTTINFQGHLKYNYIVNADLKISKFGNKTVNFNNVNVELASDSSTGFIRCIGTFIPRFEHMNTKALNYAVFQFESTHLAMVRNCNLYGMVDGATRSYGYNHTTSYCYGINDASGWATSVDGCSFYNLRHCYTTGSGGPDGTARDSGEPVSARISNCYAKQCFYAFDSHAQGLDINFYNCFAEDGVGGFQVRARGTTIVGGKAKNCDKGILIQTQHDTNVPATRTSFVEYTSVMSCHTIACGNAIEIDNDSGIHMPTKITGCVFEGGTLVFKGGNSEMSGCIHTTIGKKGGGEAGEWMVVENGATLKITNHSTTFSAAYTNGFKINATSGCNVFIDGLRLINKSSSNFRFYSASSTPTTKTSILVMKNVTVIGKGPYWNSLASTESERFPAREVNGLLVLRMQWKVESMTNTQELGRSSSWLEEKSSSTIPLILHNHLMLDDEVNMNVTIHTNTPYTLQPGAFYGQKLYVSVNGATLTLNGNALVAGSEAEFIYKPTGWKLTRVENPLS